MRERWRRTDVRVRIWILGVLAGGLGETILMVCREGGAREKALGALDEVVMWARVAVGGE
jgi:hypothetical protein